MNKSADHGSKYPGVKPRKSEAVKIAKEDVGAAKLARTRQLGSNGRLGN